MTRLAHFGRIAIFALLVGLTTVHLAKAKDADADTFIGAYTASWAGLPAADIQLSLDQNGQSYHSQLRVATKGFPRWFTHFRTDVTAEGRFTDEGKIYPSRYDALYDLRKRHDNHISMFFLSRNGTIVAERGKNDTSHKPVLPGFYRANIIDPLSALTAMRHQLLSRTPRAAGKFTMPIYDGARRFDAIVYIRAADQKDRLIHLRLTLVPIAGFKGETSEDGDPDTAPRPLDVVLTNDARLLPVAMRVSIAWLPFVVQFNHVCSTIKDCL